jgi:hypothetical protein
MFLNLRCEEKHTFAINEGQTVGSDIKISKSIYSGDIRKRGNGDVFPSRECLHIRLHIRHQKDRGTFPTCLQIFDSYSRVSLREMMRGYFGSGGAVYKRSKHIMPYSISIVGASEAITYGKVAPLRANLEHPKPPVLIQSRLLVLGVIERSEALGT